MRLRVPVFRFNTFLSVPLILFAVREQSHMVKRVTDGQAQAYQVSLYCGYKVWQQTRLFSRGNELELHQIIIVH